MKNFFLLLAIAGCSALTAPAQNWRQWATYYGGSGTDIGTCVATDASGNVYLAGYTTSLTGINTAGAHQATNGGNYDAFLVKFNSAGVRQWGTYYGGSMDEYVFGLRTDATGNVYLSGMTDSNDSIATAGAHQTINQGQTDGFLVKFNSSGVRQWGTYYGGVDFDMCTNIAADAAGNVFITGRTLSTADIATPASFQNTGGGGGYTDAFLVKFNSIGVRQWGTYYGGPDSEGGSGLATDVTGNVYLSGYTSSTSGIASAGAFQNSIGGAQDAFLTKFNTAGNRIWGTYYGGSGTEYGFGVAKGPGAGGSVYLAGQTNSASGIASGGFQNVFAGVNDAYLVRFDTSGMRVWGTYYGGADSEEGYDVATDTAGYIFLSGDSYSQNLLNCVATPNGFQTNLAVTENFFLAAFHPGGTRLSATYYGANHEEEAHVAVNAYGDAYISGMTPNASGIASGGHQNTFGGTFDGVLVKFTTAVPDVVVVVPNDSFPPTPPIITTSPPPKKWYISGVVQVGTTTITSAALRNFSPSQPLPASGSSTITFTCDFSGMYSNGSSPIPVTCTATAQVKVTYLSASGSTRFYDTELLQLNLSGGTLPSGVMVRESPTKTSYGKIVITDIGGGLFQMSSFFDVFTELSTNGGISWQPNGNPPARMQLQDDVQTSIPTLSEWGLISLCILILTMGVFYVRRIV